MSESSHSKEPCTSFFVVDGYIKLQCNILCRSLFFNFRTVFFGVLTPGDADFPSYGTESALKITRLTCKLGWIFVQKTRLVTGSEARQWISINLQQCTLKR